MTPSQIFLVRFLGLSLLLPAQWGCSHPSLPLSAHLNRHCHRHGSLSAGPASPPPVAPSLTPLSRCPGRGDGLQPRAVYSPRWSLCRRLRWRAAGEQSGTRHAGPRRGAAAPLGQGRRWWCQGKRQRARRAPVPLFLASRTLAALAAPLSSHPQSSPSAWPRPSFRAADRVGEKLFPSFVLFSFSGSLIQYQFHYTLFHQCRIRRRRR